MACGLYRLTPTHMEKLSLQQLINRINRAPDFMWDDEAAELKRRGLSWKFDKNNKIILI